MNVMGFSNCAQREVPSVSGDWLYLEETEFCCSHSFWLPTGLKIEPGWRSGGLAGRQECSEYLNIQIYS